jgi:glycerol uptake facilitator-like aquaporin
MAGEVLGAFFLTFLYLTQTEEKTKLSKDPAITTLIMASAYLASMFLVSGPDDSLTPLNPAAALGVMFQKAFHNDSKGFEYIYVYLPFPFIGSALAVVFHEFVYKRVKETIQESEDVDQVLDKNDDEDVLGHPRN